MIVTQREREAETQAEGEADSMHREPDVGFDPGSPGSRPGPKAGAKLRRQTTAPPRDPDIASFISYLPFLAFVMLVTFSGLPVDHLLCKALVNLPKD